MVEDWLIVLTVQQDYGACLQHPVSHYRAHSVLILLLVELIVLIVKLDFLVRIQQLHTWLVLPVRSLDKNALVCVFSCNPCQINISHAMCFQVGTALCEFQHARHVP